MEYIIVFDDDTKDHACMENFNGFIEKYASYDDAKKEAEEWKTSGDCRDYSIYAICTDERNHVI